MKLEVMLFGPLRPFGSALEVEVPEGASAREAREALGRALDGRGGTDATRALLARSALATDAEILADDAPLPPGTRALAVLPPVCGG